MIKVVNGNILNAKENIIGHQVNCMGVMGAGLAKQLRNKSEIIYSNYKYWCQIKPKEELLGSVQFVRVAQNKYVANIFGQYGYGRDGQYTNYKALRSGLSELKDFAQQNDLTVALPYGIGCGLAGGEWDIVYRIIDEVFQDYGVTLYKFK